MLSPAEQSRALRGLSALTLRDLEHYWARLDLSRPERLAVPLAAILEEIARKYGPVAATLAADWFDEARDEAGVGGSFRSLPATLPESGSFEALARWGVGPMFGGAGDAAALALIGGALTRKVLNMARDTTSGSAALDPAGAYYIRVARPGACRFCTERAAEEAWRAPDAASRVDGSTRKLSRSAGAQFHGDCHCVTVPKWDQ